MFTCMILTTHRFDNAHKAEALLTFLLTEGGVFTPTRFGTVEAARTQLFADQLKSPTDLLTGAPSHRWGDIFLKGAKSKALIWLHWSEALALQTWSLYIEEKFLKSKTGVDEYLGFLARLFAKYPPFFAGAANSEEWDIKRFSEDDGSVMKGASKARFCLPGLYWLTVFGPELTALVGKQSLLKAPAGRSVELEGGCTALILADNPFDKEEVRRNENAILDAIGRQYFAEKDAPEQNCEEIVKVIRRLSVKGQSHE